MPAIAGTAMAPRIRASPTSRTSTGWTGTGTALNALHGQGTTRDFYAGYGPDATWGSEPPNVLSQGGTIITRRNQLQTALTPLLPQAEVGAVRAWR